MSRPKTLAPPTVIGFPVDVIDRFDTLMGRAIRVTQAAITLDETQADFVDDGTCAELVEIVLENLKAAKQLIDDAYNESVKGAR